MQSTPNKFVWSQALPFVLVMNTPEEWCWKCHTQSISINQAFRVQTQRSDIFSTSGQDERTCGCNVLEKQSCSKHTRDYVHKRNLINPFHRASRWNICTGKKGGSARLTGPTDRRHHATCPRWLAPGISPRQPCEDPPVDNDFTTFCCVFCRLTARWALICNSPQVTCGKSEKRERLYQCTPCGKLKMTSNWKMQLNRNNAKFCEACDTWFPVVLPHLFCPSAWGQGHPRNLHWLISHFEMH